MISTQRLAITALLISLLFGIIINLANSEISTTGLTQNLTQWDNQQSTDIDKQANTQGEGLWARTAGAISDTFYEWTGDAGKYIVLTYRILRDSINPFSISPTDLMEENTFLGLIGWMVAIFRTILTTIMIIEIVMIIRNKKQS